MAVDCPPPKGFRRPPPRPPGEAIARIHRAAEERWRSEQAKPPRECPDCGATDTLVFFYGCTHERCPVLTPAEDEPND